MYPFFSGKANATYSFRELEALSSNKLFTLIDNIPSDNESELGDVSDYEENEEPSPSNTSNNDLFDINNLPIDFEDNVEMADEYDGWESEDDIPLAVIRRTEISKNTIWTKLNENCLKFFKNFEEETGPNIGENLETPVDVFLAVFPDDLIRHIVFQTNLYALQKYENSSLFTPTNEKEMRKFLAINMLMGVKKLPSCRDYWSSSNVLRDHFISSVLSRDRFVWLLGNFHLNDNAVVPNRHSVNYDKLYRLRPVIDRLSETFSSTYRPSKNQSIDESMIRFKGRSSLKQYMPMKPVKRGYKVWVRADESGFACQFQIYTGKSGDSVEKDLGARVVTDLTRSLVGKGHYVYYDNYFNSVPLQKKLQSEMIYACGTIRRGRRNLPDDILDDKHMKRGQSDWRISKDGLAYLKWMDRKGVHFLSNYSDPSTNAGTSRKQKDGTIENINCPLLVVEYNKNMGFVDKLDMLKSIYELDRKSKKWWHRIFWYLLDVSLVNAYIIFKHRSNTSQSRTTLSLKNFKIAVSLGLIGADENTPKRGRPQSTLNTFKTTVPQEIRYDSCAHMPVHGNSRRCAHCSTTAVPHRTRWMCTRYIQCNLLPIQNVT